jgi:hypothetical protein
MGEPMNRCSSCEGTLVGDALDFVANEGAGIRRAAKAALPRELSVQTDEFHPPVPSWIAAYTSAEPVD